MSGLDLRVGKGRRLAAALLLTLLVFVTIENVVPVYAASISLNPTSGPVGTNVSLTGTGFNTDARVLFSYTDNLNDGGQEVDSVCPSSGGSISCSFIVPATQTGNHYVVASTHNTDQGLVYAQALFTVTSAPPPGGTFSVGVSKVSMTVAPGGFDTNTVTVTLTSGTPASVSLSLSGLPSGVTYAFTPQSGTPTFSSTLTTTADNTAPSGTYPLTVTGTGGGNSATTAVSLVVSAQAFDFGLAASPATAAVIAGSAANYGVSVSLQKGAPQTVALTTSTPPSGTTAFFSQSSGNPPFSSTLTLTTAPSSTPGTYGLNVIGTAGAAAHSAQIVLTIQAATHASTTTTVVCVPGQVAVNAQTTCTATVKGNSPRGTVSFTTTSSGGSFNPSNGACTLPSSGSGACSETYVDAQAGVPTISATYSGDINNDGSTGPFRLTVTSAAASLCPVSDVKGAFEPTQGVWQDDDVFPDMPGKQLLKQDDAHYAAQLAMVKDKPTLLFGLKGARNLITFSFISSGSANSPAVVTFTVSDSRGADVVYTYDAGSLPISGSCTNPLQRSIEIHVPTGIPSAPFLFTADGPYSITMELASNGAKVAGSQVVVVGNVISVPGLKINFMPAYLTSSDQASQRALVVDSTKLALDVDVYVPNYFPVPVGSIQGYSDQSANNLTSFVTQAHAECKAMAAQTGTQDTKCFGNRLVGDLEAYVAVMAWALGVDRVVLFLPRGDFQLLIQSTAQNPMTAAFSSNDKTIFAQDGNDHWTIAHELAHTLPRFPWLVRGGVCGLEFHNVGPGLGNGVQVMNGALRAGKIEERVLGIMGGSANVEQWIEQCTYWHLLSALQQKVDPPVLAINGWFMNYAGKEFGGFSPGFSLDGAPNLSEQSVGNYSLVFIDDAGRTLAKYSFNATGVTSEGVQIGLTSFTFEVPLPSGATKLSLVSASGVLASESVPSSKPSVTITSPSSGSVLTNTTGNLELDWTAGSPNLTFYVMASPDGTKWYSVAMGINSTKALVPKALLAPGNNNLLRVLASNGVFSGDSTIKLGVVGGGVPTQITYTAQLSALNPTYSTPPFDLLTVSGQSNPSNVRGEAYLYVTLGSDSSWILLNVTVSVQSGNSVSVELFDPSNFLLPSGQVAGALGRFSIHAPLTTGRPYTIHIVQLNTSGSTDMVQVGVAATPSVIPQPPPPPPCTGFTCNPIPIYAVVIVVLVAGGILGLVFVRRERGGAPATAQGSIGYPRSSSQAIQKGQRAMQPYALLETSTGQSLPVYQTKKEFGRDDFVFLPLDSQRLVSRRHFGLSYSPKEDTFMIGDLGSTNGTFVNGSDIRGRGSVPLKKDDIVSLGGVVNLRFKR